jgi:hypothetical protein
MNTVQFSAGGKLLSLILATFISACASLQPVNVADTSGRGTITKGDTVVISTHSGETHTFKVVDITADGLHGQKISIPYSDMRQAQIRRVDMKKTLWITLGIIGLGAIISNDDSNGGNGGGGY